MSDTDRELLTWAAKAAGSGVVATPSGAWYEWYNEGANGRPWNPLTDDGDALRLAVKLNLSADFFDDAIFVGCVNEATKLMEPVGTDPYAATRRAIVRAAAAIGGGNG